jgi:PTS system cellobiose-specific IIA component
MTHIEEVAFQMISAAGDGQAKVLEAFKQARRGNFGDAEDLLKDADVLFLKAHQLQTDELITKQANGELTEAITVIVTHAQDYVMSAMVMKDVAQEVVTLYSKIRAIK